ncbi:hypothetical protein J2741_000504 [Methanolinea mesophila]|uniref:hypothetical protein n=1 Tax=Methanolinea mesophila TaxID=547055 RepID=UPI001AE57B26|nr:hypothetical protein [Methanolinea mesophila]MBP1927957.1 hypothetical protein [Methanolinea mesophila]
MEKRDLAIVIAALAIVIVLALVVKPALTGKPPDLSIPIPGTEPTPSPTPTLPDWAKDYYASSTTSATPVPTPSPTWSGQSQTLGIVGPGSTPEPTLSHSRLPEEPTPVPEKMLVYATIDGNYGGMTENISMPFPYWELQYTVEPWDRFVGVTESKAGGIASSMGTQVFPSFSIEVRDASDPDRVIRTIEPAGGLDPDLWGRGDDYDPRPWVEKFYEGTSRGSYYFVIKPHMIRSYHIEILVPERYLGNY